jgi:hypothetical protein
MIGAARIVAIHHGETAWNVTTHIRVTPTLSSMTQADGKNSVWH